ncbi:MAG TPA: four-carbon acid sugar kinase family protein [Candidatus Sulfopaludibacter sp.]|nr:four-carbon acid sugar kinase family protein [Candidatus Sulfopaludibacter sp.]
MDCLLIADDLTGACDAAVPFAVRGRSTSVMLELDAPHAAVVAVNTESRHLTEAQIPAVIHRVASAFPSPRIVFKKIDSTLRGNPAAEIAAAIQAFHCDAAIVTPAFPAQGRLVRNGRLNLGDLDVPAVLRADCHVAPDGVDAAIHSGARIVSVDAVTDADLDRIAAAGSHRRILWAGSAGLAAALARQSGGTPAPPRAPRSPVHFCIGSDHPVTLAQIDELRRHRPQSTILRFDELVDLPPALLLSGGDTAAAVCRAAGARRIDLYGEVLPGIPWGVLRCGRFDGVPVITKSGGFGAPDALIRIAEFFE